MASLAIIVGIIFLVVLLSGPIIYLISKYHLLPKIIIQILAIITICVGLWWTAIIVTPIRFLGLFTSYLAWKAIKTQEEVLDSR